MSSLATMTMSQEFMTSEATVDTDEDWRFCEKQTLTLPTKS